MMRPCSARTLVRATLLVLLWSLWSTEPAAQSDGQTFTVRGQIADAATGQAVYLANVRLMDTQLGGTTDAGGNFVIEFVPAGTYSLLVSRVGYKSVVRESFIVDPESEKHLRLSLIPVVQSLKEITVTPGSFSFMEGPTTQIMTRRDIESVPQFGEDIFRAVNRLPGLSSGDISAHFSIRVDDTTKHSSCSTGWSFTNPII